MCVYPMLVGVLIFSQKANLLHRQLYLSEKHLCSLNCGKSIYCTCNCVVLVRCCPELHVWLLSLFCLFLCISFSLVPELMCSSIIIRPVDHADRSRIVEPGHTVVALRESQCKCHNPNHTNHNLGGGGGEAGL